MANFILFESASGYSLFECSGGEEIGEKSIKIQAQIQDFKHFSKSIHLKAFTPFESAENALENINDLSEGILNPTLRNFLQFNLPSVKGVVLGVSDEKIGLSIKDSLSLKVDRSQHVNEMMRAIRLHFPVFLKQLAGDNFNVEDIRMAQRGLAHAYSRSKVKFNINKADNMIIHSICLLDQLDKDVNGFSMRLREWYSRHFPELGKVVTDHIVYARCVQLIGPRSSLTTKTTTTTLLDDLTDLVGDEEKAQQILSASKMSIGIDLSEFDLLNIIIFSKRVIKLAEHRNSIQKYLYSRMNEVAPNLSSLIGEVIGARLINHAGSLTNLSKYPASTVQILGAEKALFRALKSRGNTPKYGHIFNSGFIGKAKQKDKGRISRYLANKCSIASRLDAFGDFSTHSFGEHMKKQVEDRLNFYETGQTPPKNVEVMKMVIDGLGHNDVSGAISSNNDTLDNNKKTKTSKSKRKSSTSTEQKQEHKTKRSKKN